MSKTINTLISSLLLSLSAYAGTVSITTSEPASIRVKDGRPITINTNFQLKGAEILMTKSDAATLRLLEKGFVIVPSVMKYVATIVLSARDGSVYTLDVKTGGSEAVFRVEDALQGYKGKAGSKMRFESNRIDDDARNIIKAVLLDRKLSGFQKIKAVREVEGDQFLMRREYRHVGGKYVADRWSISNTTDEAIYFGEEDFYTKGIMAVAIEKNRVQPGESIYLILLVNKQSVFEAERG